jgi:hypothetical protein
VFDLLDTYTVNALFFDINAQSVSNPKIENPDFIKYTGDGALLIWLRSDGQAFSEKFRTLLVATFRKFQEDFAIKAREWERDWCTNDLPKSLRVGISTGFVFPRREPSVTLFLDDGPIKDYAGYCINLATRLQAHCPKIGFLVHRNINPNLPGLLPFHALGMKGTTNEPIFLFEKDFKGVEKEETYWRTKFRREEK